MNFLSDIYEKKLAETEKSLRSWEDVLQNLTSLDFNAYSDKLTVPTLVPIGSRIFFRGELKHTNEVTVALGADYFAKCSLKQAEVLRQHRIKNCQSKVAIYKKEKEYLENQIAFTKENIYRTEEIIETYTEEEDIAWREKHRENIRRYKQDKGKQEIKEDVISDEELWNRLEELELKEELENELHELTNNSRQENSFEEDTIIEENAIHNQTNIELNSRNKNQTLTKPVEIESNITKEQIVTTETKKLNIEENESHKKVLLAPVQTPNLKLLQKVIDRQNELENKFLEMKNRERSSSKTENDLISKLDEMEQLDELEDEMERLDDILQIEDYKENVNDNSKSPNTMVERKVSFADEDDSETLEISFKHSNVEPGNTLYDPEKGILKPSDIYGAYASSFGEATSILKKTKYNTGITIEPQQFKKSVVTVESEASDPDINKTIVISDIIERVANKENKSGSESRPTSLFKKKRMQNK